MAERTTPHPLVFDVDDPRLARAAWTRLAEPGDEVAGALVRELGAPAALHWVVEAAHDPARARSALAAAAPTSATGAAPRLLRALSRWAPRLDGLDPRRELRVLARVGGTFVVPGDPGWPVAVDDLGVAAPLGLWVRGRADLAAASARSVAVVGARACTDYGRYVTGEMAAGLADRGFAVVSGGAYGVDAVAHRGALVGGGVTVAFLAGGVDRLYPAGNAELLAGVVDAGGAVVSEVPPGSVPSRVRFLLRNRLIAAFARATVVVEAAWRSGSLSTAARAAELSRPVGAVPGPVTSAASSGCHRLLRDGAAVCVTDAAEVAELAGVHGTDVVPAAARAHEERPALHDGLDEVATRAWDALPLRSGRPVESVARAAGLAVPETLAALGGMEVSGLAERVAGGWRRARVPDER
ncbi:DNA-processing protein DprA [Cellulosimicrobium marinum]|uniref:DNA-processing protein DprA n=1 Tax=Cellulosimicrobium marinum TaxID=1638992 RepID=UPI001E2D9F94|nr:DNA-processing protein DprA [Cellulosimicrobium marinum]MCB7137687.1 DNA-processing protein DprA [Cellulosimicrobium marinum]